MSTFTYSLMAGLMPEKSSIESIGSVAANFARSSMEEQRLEHIRFSNNSSLAEMILATRGEAAYAAYIADMQAQSEAERLHEAARLARKLARKEAIKRCWEQVKALVKIAHS